MCGIHGITSNNPDLVRKMIKLSSHRGPDGHGLYQDNDITLGHNLLSITGLNVEEGHQPWILPDSVLVYNGEIYNHEELEKGLSVESLRTETDTEILAHGLAEEGHEFIRKLDGMYAIAHYDKEVGTLCLARDSFGSKPLYYSVLKNNRIVFSSELRALLLSGIERKIDQFSFHTYMDLGFVPGPKTFVTGVSKLVPGQVIVFDVVSGKKLEDYNVAAQVPSAVKGFSKVELYETLNESVRRCTMGRRKIALYLSGGMDSCAILHHLCEMGQKPITITTRFACRDVDKFNGDAMVAAQVAAHYGTEHHELTITEKQFTQAIPKSVLAQEEPRYNKSTPLYFLVHREAARLGVTVVITGDGGDELLAGYPRHLEVLDPPLYNEVWKDLEKRYKRFKGDEMSFRFYMLNDPICRWHYFSSIQKGGQGFLRNPMAAPTIRKRIEYFRSWFPTEILTGDDLNNHLCIETMNHMCEDFLIRNDKLGMHFGIETRFPILTKLFRNYAFSISGKTKLRLGRTKRLIIDSYRGKLPKPVLMKKKTGWTAPVMEWADIEDFPRNARTLLGRSMRKCLTKSWHEETDSLFRFDSLVYPKTIFSAFYFRMWAKEMEMFC